MDNLQKYDFGKNALCVGRVSTAIQSQTAQINDLQQFAHSLGYEKIEVVFSTESGFLEYDDKQGWNVVTNFFENHKDFKVLICPEISRLSRKESILFTIKEYLIKNKIQLIIKDIHFTLFDEWGEIPKGNDIVFALYASLADSEMRQKKERFKRGLADNRRLGYSLGGRELFGYTRYYEKKDGKSRSKYKINEEEAKQVIQIYKWYLYGIDGDTTNTSILHITKKCIEEGFSPYLHSKRNVNKCLKEEAYLGVKETKSMIKNPEFWNYKKLDKPKYIPGQSYVCVYPPIFIGKNESLFEMVQKRLKENCPKYSKKTLTDKSTKHVTILAKLIVCPLCGCYLGGEYRIRTDARRPNLVERDSYTYRCSHSRNMVKVCQFKHSFSMKLFDSIVWSYCKKSVEMSILLGSALEIDSQKKEIDSKIKNLKNRIKDFNYDARIKAEDAILRTKTKSAKSQEYAEKAIVEYKHHINDIDKELKGYNQRISELEQEKVRLSQTKELLTQKNEIEAIKESKKSIYKYIHKMVERIDIIFADKYYSILKIRLTSDARWGASYRLYWDDTYLCVYKKVTKKPKAFLVYPRDKYTVRIDASGVSHKGMQLPNNDKLDWDKENEMFVINDEHFTFNQVFEYYKQEYSNDNPYITNAPFAPITIKKLDIERLTCYDEDWREKE